MKVPLVLVAFLLSSIQCISQTNLQWHFKSNGTNNGIVYQMNKFQNNDLLVFGYNDKGDIDPGASVDTSGRDFFARYSTSGNLVFARPFSYNTFNMNSRGYVKLDKDDNFYLSFRGPGTVDFDSVPGVGEVVINDESALVKFDMYGKYKWSIVYTGGVSIYNFILDDDNAVIVSGIVDGGTFDLDPGPGTFLTSTGGWHDGFIAKFDSSGNFVTAKIFHTNSIGQDYLTLAYIDRDSLGNIYLGGHMQGTFDLDPGTSVYNLSGGNINLSTYCSMFIKLDNNMNFVHANIFPHDLSVHCYFGDLAGNIFIQGVFKNPIDIDPGPGVYQITTPANHGSWYMAKFNPNGNFLWAKTITTSYNYSGATNYLPYVDEKRMINVDMQFVGSMVSNNIGLPSIPSGFYLFQIDTSGTCMTYYALPVFQNPRTLMAGPNNFYFSGRIWEPTDIQIGPGITAIKPDTTWNEFFVSYYSRDPNVSRIHGNAFLDLNGNSTHDANENGVKNVIAEIVPGNYFLSTDANGDFSAYVTPDNYTMTIPVNPNWMTGPIPVVNYANFTTSNQLDTNNYFAYETDYLHKDVAVYITDVGQARPGMNFGYHITYSNLSVNMQSGAISLLLDSSLSFVSSIPPPDNLNGNQLTWNYANLAALVSTDFNLVVNVDSSASIGDTIISSTSITAVNGDGFLLNNFDTVHTVLTGSYDPNNKEVYPFGALTDEQTSLGQLLTYTVNFQNTGNDTAFFVTILDTLSSLLDISSLEIVSSSHDYIFKLYPGNLMEFRFQNILLPDSNVNELGSHGFVKYQIKTKTNLYPGNVIPNAAYIYFDYNSSVVTNTVMTPVVDFVGIEEMLASGGIAAFPNPFKDKLNIVFQNPNQLKTNLTIRDVSGRLILQSETSNDHFILNNPDIACGVFIVEVENQTGKQYLKIVKLF